MYKIRDLNSALQVPESLQMNVQKTGKVGDPVDDT